MKRTINSLLSLFAAAAILAGCEKKIDPIDNFGVEVTYKATDPKAATGDITLNPKDSFVLDFDLTSSREDIAVIEIQKNGAKIDTFKMSGTGVRSFSGQKRYQIDSVTGDYSFRVLARNSRGVFIGDGNKLIRVSVKSDYNFWSYRFLYVPDSAAKVSKSYFATSTGESFSYTEGMTKSGLIDFGYYFDTTRVSATNLTPRGHTIYNLTVNPYVPSDISTWTKNATAFKLVTNVTFNNLTSAGAIRTAGIANLGSGTVAKVSTTDRASASWSSHLTGAVILFRTAAGKYGALQVNFTEHNGASPGSYINLDVRVEK